MTPTSNIKNALLELQHIELELKNKRTHHFRHFVDQYYCYKNNHVNRNGRAKWEDMVWKRFTSTEASNLSCRKDVRKEHVVPLNIITTILVQHSKEQILNTEKISEILDKYVTFATISKREDKLLRDAKLSKKMPEGFWEVKNPLYNDLFARYKFVGIELNLISNTSDN